MYLQNGHVAAVVVEGVCGGEGEMVLREVELVVGLEEVLDHVLVLDEEHLLYWFGVNATGETGQAGNLTIAWK